MALFADQSTTNVAAIKQQESRLASAGPVSPADNVYTQLKLSFAIDSIQMELFTGDRDVVSVVIAIVINALAELYIRSLAGKIC